MENKITLPLSLFRSKTRQALLALFLTNPEKRFYARQLQAMLDMSIGTVHRELTGLERMGVLKSAAEGNIKFYSADPDYPLFEEISKIVAKTVGAEGSLRQAVQQIPGVRLAFIYGSFASGSTTVRSDIDVFLIGEIDENLLNNKLGAIEQLLQREINYTYMAESEFRNESRQSSAFVTNVLAEPKIFLVGDEDELRALAG